MCTGSWSRRIPGAGSVISSDAGCASSRMGRDGAVTARDPTLTVRSSSLPEARDDLASEQLDRLQHGLVRDGVRVHETEQEVDAGLLVATAHFEAVVGCADD